MEPLTIFRFGYEGWGNHTTELVQAADAVEQARGFAPPCFVDIRIRRAVRAKGFVNNHFGELLGERYRWMKGLGNRRIVEGAPGIEIDDPRAADELLAMAVSAAERKQRLVYFCSCKWAKVDGQVFCHRAAVDELLYAAAQERGVALAVEEWPGGAPDTLALDVKDALISAVASAARKSIPVDMSTSPAELGRLAGLGWASKAELRGDKARAADVLVGPAQYTSTGWQLPVLQVLQSGQSNAEAATHWRDAHGC